MLLPGQESYSLGELCKALMIPLTTAHRAAADAEATADLLLHLLERIEEIYLKLGSGYPERIRSRQRLESNSPV